jgi:hypothetical protein
VGGKWGVSQPRAPKKRLPRRLPRPGGEQVAVTRR